VSPFSVTLSKQTLIYLSLERFEVRIHECIIQENDHFHSSYYGSLKLSHGKKIQFHNKNYIITNQDKYYGYVPDRTGKHYHMYSCETSCKNDVFINWFFTCCSIKDTEITISDTIYQRRLKLISNNNICLNNVTSLKQIHNNRPMFNIYMKEKNVFIHALLLPSKNHKLIF
jgi:hypothetical protein